MRGRRPCPLALAADDVAVLRMIGLRSRSRPWFVKSSMPASSSVPPPGIWFSPSRCRRSAIAPRSGGIRRSYEEHGLDVARRGKLTARARPQRIPLAGESCSWPGAGTDRQGVAHHALDQFRLGPSSGQRMVSSQRSARARSGRFCTMSTCNRIARWLWRRLASTPSSRHGPSTSCGATEMLRIWPVRRAVGRLR